MSARLRAALLRLGDGSHGGSTVSRWATNVLRGCESEHDPRTLQTLARINGVSYTSLRETCYLVHIRPRDARDFTRVLRAIVHAGASTLGLEQAIDVSDRRTLTALLRRAGLEPGRHDDDLLGQFFQRQSYIQASHPGVRLLAELLA